MKSHDLRDNWCRSGADIKTFKEAIEDIAKST